VRLEQDILVPLAAKRQVSYYETQDYWCQVKTPNSAITANRLVLEETLFKHPEAFAANKEAFEAVGAVYVDPSARIAPDARLGPNVSIGPNCVIGSGVRVRDSIILDGSTIQTNSIVVNSIIGSDSHIGTWCRIEGAPDGAITDAITVNGIKMPSITVLGGHVHVDDEKVIRNCIVLPHKDLHKSYQNEILL
jgi:mannose-1-phosphate guanylyltransferase